MAPQKPGELWFGSTDHPASTTALIRSVGARDLGLGLGLVADPRPDSAWLKAGIIADVGDVIASFLNRDRIPAKNFLTGFVGAGLYVLMGCAVALFGRTAR